MLTAIMLASVLSFPTQVPDDTPPGADEKSALEALKKVGFQVFGQPNAGRPPGTIIIYRPDPKSEPPSELTAKILEPFRRLPRTRHLEARRRPDRGRGARALPGYV